MMRNPKVQFAIGVIISAIALAWTLRPVALKDLWAAVSSFQWVWAGPFLLLTFLSMWMRALRWRFLMQPTRDFTAKRLFSPMMAGFAINSLFPARAGEFLRASVLSIREKVPFSSVFATIVLERLFDSLTLLLLAAVTFSLLKIPPDARVTYGGLPELTGEQLHAVSIRFGYFCALLLAGAIAILLAPVRRVLERIILAIPFAPRRMRETIAGMVEHFAAGMRSLRDFQSLVLIIAYSLGVWIAVGASMQVLALGFPGMRMSLMQGVAITVITCIAILIPAAPGYWGLMEVGIIFGLQVLDVERDKSRALAYAFVCHSLQIFPIIGVGMYCLWREGFSVGEVVEAVGKLFGQSQNDARGS